MFPQFRCLLLGHKSVEERVKGSDGYDMVRYVCSRCSRKLSDYVSRVS